MESKTKSLFIILFFCLSDCYSTQESAEADSIDEQVVLKEEADGCVIRFGKKLTALHLQYQKEREKFNMLSKKQKEREKKRKFLRAINPPSSDSKINEYANIRNIDLASSNGNIVLSGTVGAKFSVDSVGPLNLTLKNVSSLDFKNEAVTLKSGDIINIVGKNNTFNLYNTLTIEGSLLFDTDSQLIVNFLTDDAQIIFDASNVVDLESNVELKFTGDGVVLLKDGATINLKGNTVNPELYPSFILENSARLNVDDSVTGLIKGVGNIIVKNGALIDIRGYGNTKHLNIGDEETDHIDLYVSNGMVRVDGGITPYRSAYSYAPPSGNYGSIAFGKGVFNLTFKLGGALYIGSGGWIEFNSVLAIPTDKGHLEKIDFGPDGRFCLMAGGLLSFANNDFWCSVELKTKWIADDSNLFGDNGGEVEYIARDPIGGYAYQGFHGVFKSSAFMFKNIDGLLPREIVSLLIT